MQEFDIKGRTTVTATIKAQIDDSPLALPPPNGLGSESFQSFAEAASDSTDSLKENSAIIKEFGNIMPEIVKNLRYMNDIVSRTNQNLPAISKVAVSQDKRLQQIDDYNRQNFMQLMNTGSNAVQSVANGNVTGAVVGGINSIANVSNSASKMASAADMAGLAKGLVAGGVIATVAGLVIKGGDTLANKFLEEMPTIYGTGRAFGSLSDEASLRSYERINNFNQGTGLDIAEFQGIAQALRKQGVGNGVADQETLVGDIARTTSRWAYATGGSADQYAQLAGLMSRYGGSTNVSEDFNKLVTAGYASGLNDTQIPEFLSGIQKVMEDGIAKGFTRSSTEVADTLLMFSKMSGGDVFWQGEKGATLLNQVNTGIAGATALSKSEDILVYSAFKNAYQNKDLEKKLGSTYVSGADYVNTMQLIEQGVNGENFGAIRSILYSTYGNDQDAKIEALRNMTGLNYTGAARLLNLDMNASDTQIQDIMRSPENLNKETRYQEAVNDIKEAVVKIGSKASEIKIEGMELVADNVQKIANKIVGTEIDTSIDFGFDVDDTNDMKSVSVSKGEIADNALFGYEASDDDWETGYIRRNNIEGINKLLRMGDFGEFILSLAGGDTTQANTFLRSVLSDENTKNSTVSDLKGMVDWVTSDSIVYKKDERDRDDPESIKGILTKLYQLFSEGGLIITENQ
jgi:hypothetical protein